MKIPVVQKGAYTIYFDRKFDLTFVHCDVYRWNRSIKQSLDKDWETLCLLHNEPIYATHVVGDKKHTKFLKMYGFKYVSKSIAHNLIELEIYRKDIP